MAPGPPRYAGVDDNHNGLLHQTMRIFIAGQKAFGDQVYKLCKARGHEIAGVSAPPFGGDGKKPDRLRADAEADGVPWIEAGTLNANTLPDNVDLICAAHSHDFIGAKTRDKARLGAIVITSYSIHYTKLYDCDEAQPGHQLSGGRTMPLQR